MEIISRRQYREVTKYQMVFERLDNPNLSYAFDCDENGNVVLPDHPVAVERLERFQRGEGVRPGYISDLVYKYTDAAVGRCEECGAEVTLDRFTCTCDGCGADYNMSGQRLAPRCQWGEETGESVSDILAADCDNYRDDFDDY